MWHSVKKMGPLQVGRRNERYGGARRGDQRAAAMQRLPQSPPAACTPRSPGVGRRQQQACRGMRGNEGLGQPYLPKVELRQQDLVAQDDADVGKVPEGQPVIGAPRDQERGQGCMAGSLLGEEAGSAVPAGPPRVMLWCGAAGWEALPDCFHLVSSDIPCTSYQPHMIAAVSQELPIVEDTLGKPTASAGALP